MNNTVLKKLLNQSLAALKDHTNLCYTMPKHITRLNNL